MIELEHDRISLAAVNTRVRLEVTSKARSVCTNVDGLISADTLHLTLMILPVSLGLVSREALLAPRL
jgi:hypothetical protein